MGKEVADLPVTVVHNPDWEEGIASSIRAGVAAAGDTAKAILIMLCDQPRVTTGLLDEIISAYLSSGKRIVACEYGGTLGAPALFDHSLVSELTGLRGDRGAKQVIAEHPADVHRITFPGGVVDIDTTDDYRSLVT